MVNNNGKPQTPKESGRAGMHTWQGLKSNESTDGIQNVTGFPTGTLRRYASTGVESGKVFAPTGVPGSHASYNKTRTSKQEIPALNVTTAVGIENSTLTNVTSDHSSFNASTYHNTKNLNSTDSNSTSAYGISHSVTFANTSWSNSSFGHGNLQNVSFANSTSRNLSSNYLPSHNLPFTNLTSGNFTFVIPGSSNNVTSNSTSSLWPLSGGNRNSKLDQADDCSSTVTKNVRVHTKTFITTTLIEEGTTTIYGDATTPLPVFVTPLQACHTVWVFGDVHPGGASPSTLLVTKKTPVIIRAPQTVGPIYNVPTTSPQPTHVTESIQPAVNGEQAMPTTQPSVGATAQAQSESNGQIVSQSSESDQSPGSAPLQQILPEVAQSIPSGSSPSGSPLTMGGQQSSGQAASGSHQSSGDGGQTSNGVQVPSTNGQTSSNMGQNPVDGGQTSAGGQTSGSGDRTTNGGQTVGNNGGSPNGGEKPVGEGQTPGEQTSGSAGNPVPIGGHSSLGSTGSPSSAGQATAGQPASGGDSPGSPSSAPGTPGSAGDNGQSNTGSRGSATTPEGITQGSMSGTDPYSGQYVPKAAAVDSVPVLIASSAVIIGSHTVSAGSPPTNVIAGGQSIAIEPSQIIAPHTTIPNEAAAITPPPVTSAAIGNVPVVLGPNHIIIGSQTFSHGSSAAFAVYNGQTYSWDAKQIVGPGGTMIAFPPSTSVVPSITAGGQVFSVYSSTLKASGTDVPIPNTPEASPFIYQGQTFSVNPSQLIAPERNITVPPATQPTPFVIDKQTYSVDSSEFIAPSATLPLTSGSGTVRYGSQVITVDRTQIICPSTTITLSELPQTGSPATPSVITTEGITLTVGPQAAVLSSSTYSFLPGQAPTTITDQSQTITLESSGVNFGSVSIPVPTNPPSYSAVTQGDVTFSVAPSAVVLDGHTQSIEPSMAPIFTVVENQTISIGAQGVGFASTTIPLPSQPPSYATVTEGDMTFSVAPSEAVIKGSTFAIGPGMPATVVIDGQTVSIGPSQLNFPGTTVNIPTITSQEAAAAAVTADGFIFSVGATDAIIGGTPYAIGSGAVAETIAMGSETIKVGTNGIILPTTTIAPEQSPSAMIVDGLTFSADNSEAIINGTAYAIGSEAIAKTIVVGSETIKLGTKGIVFPSTTVAPWGNVTQMGLSSSYRSAAMSSGIAATAAAITAAAPPTGLPGSDTEGTKNDVHHGDSASLRPSNVLVMAATMAGFLLGLLALL